MFNNIYCGTITGRYFTGKLGTPHSSFLGCKAIEWEFQEPKPPKVSDTDILLIKPNFHAWQSYQYKLYNKNIKYIFYYLKFPFHVH